MEKLSDGDAIERGKAAIAQAAEQEASDLEEKLREIGDRPKPLKYVVGAFLAGLLLGALLTIGAFGGIKGHELPARAPAAESAR